MPTVRAALASGVLALSLGAPVAARPSPVPVEASDQVRVRTTLSIAAAARADEVPVGGTIRIVGTVVTKPPGKRAEPRPVVLEEKVSGGWLDAGSTTSTKRGAYRFEVQAGDVPGDRTFRAKARRFNGLPAAKAGPIVVTVVDEPDEPGPDPDPGSDEYDDPEELPDGYVGAGSADSWSYLFEEGSRWNPCVVIRWAYNAAGQGYAGLPDVQRAFAKISGASGLPFTYVGPTTWRYLGSVNDPAFPAGTADVVVGWADDDELPGLRGSVVGIGGGRGWGVEDADVGVRMDRGYLTLDNEAVLQAGFDHSGWGQVIMHEVLHALGLGHAGEPVQLMYGSASEQNVRFGAGDLTGMGRIGAPAGCLS